MLWNDPPDEPSPDLLRALRRLRRTGPVLAVASAVLVLLCFWP